MILIITFLKSGHPKIKMTCVSCLCPLFFQTQPICPFNLGLKCIKPEFEFQPTFEQKRFLHQHSHKIKNAKIPNCVIVKIHFGLQPPEWHSCNLNSSSVSSIGKKIVLCVEKFMVAILA